MTPSSNEMFGPSTTTYSSGCWASHGSSRSVVSTDWQPGGQGTEQPPGCGAVGIDDDGHVSSLEEGLDAGWTCRVRAVTWLLSVSRPKVRSSALEATITFWASFCVTAR